MNPYEELLKIIRLEGSKNNPASIQIGVMNSSISCSIGELSLSSEDLLIEEHLTTGYYTKKEDKTYFVDKLKQGDLVAVYRFSDTKYIIIGKLVQP